MVNIVPNNQEVLYESLVMNNTEFCFCSFSNLVSNNTILFFKPFISHLSKILIVIHTIWCLIERNKVFVRRKNIFFVNTRNITMRLTTNSNITFICNFISYIKSLFKTRKCLLHFLISFVIKLVSVKLHAVWIINRFLHLNTHQNILHFGIFFFKVVDVISCNKFNACFFAHF